MTHKLVHAAQAERIKVTIPIAIPAKTTLGPVKRVGPTNYEYYGIVLETDEEFADWGMPYQDVHDEDEQ